METGGFLISLQQEKHSQAMLQSKQSIKALLLEEPLLYISVSTCAVIGQFSGPYSTVRPANLKLFLLPKCFLIYHQVFLTFLASKSLKLSFTSEIVC